MTSVQRNIKSKGLLMSKGIKLFGAVAITSLCVALTTASVGCKSVPTTDTMYRTSYAVGVTTGMIANETKIDDASRNAICDVLNIVSSCVPETNQTFEAAWMPIAKAHIAKLVEDGKLDAAQARMVETTFSLIVQGIDYLFEYRFPKAKAYKEVVIAAIDGFTGGFLTVFKPANDTLSSARTVEFDAQAYQWLKANKK